MGVCLSTADVCLSAADDAVNDFVDRQSRYYKESKQAREHLKKTAAPVSHDNGCHSIVLQSELSPVYPSLPPAHLRTYCRHVYDGDTLTLEDGHRVRLLGIDTPELREKQGFALEAKEYTKKFCHEKYVWLTFQEPGGVDNEKNKDHYKRVLAFVWVPFGGGGNDTRGGKRPPTTSGSTQWLSINEGLVATGLAHAYSPSGAKKVHNRDKLLRLQQLARTHKCGQWQHYQDEDVLVTPAGGAFHKCKKKGSATSDCKHLARSKALNIVSTSDAYDRGLHPCRNCFG